MSNENNSNKLERSLTMMVRDARVNKPLAEHVASRMMIKVEQHLGAENKRINAQLEKARQCLEECSDIIGAPGNENVEKVLNELNSNEVKNV